MSVGLLSYDELNEIYENGTKPIPYVIDRVSGGQHLTFIGANHTYEPTNKIFAVIDEQFALFAKLTEGSKRVLLSEGGVRPGLADSNEAITKYGEAGYVSYLGKRNGIEVASPEPLDKDEFEYLRQGYSVDQIIYFYLCRRVAQWGRMTERPDFETEINRVIDYYRNSLLLGPEISVEWLKERHAKVTGKEFDKNQTELFKSLCNPTLDQNMTQRIARESSIFRNEHIAREIQRLWEDKESIFAVYGSAHAFVLEPFLTNL